MVLENTNNEKIDYFNLGNQLQKEGKLEEAITEYRHAIAIETNPNLHQTYIELAYLLRIIGNAEEAVTFYLKAIACKPNNWQAYARLKQGSWQEKQIEKIVNSLKKIIINHPDVVLPYMCLGHFFTLQKNIDEAVIFLQKGSNKNAANLNSNFTKIDTRKSPDFLIIGTAKSGTTSLYQYMVQHPQILPALTKEVGFFDIPRMYNNGMDWYLSHFPQVSEHENILTGEATPGYFNRANVPEKIYKYLPNIKLILILRNPVERTVSSYYHSVKDNGELRSLEEAINREIQMIQGMSDPSEIMKTKFKFEPRYLVWSLYYYFLKKWLEVFPKEQFLILNSNDFYSNPVQVMAQVFDFLELPNYELPDYHVYTQGSYTKIDNKLHNRLGDFFKPHNQKLEDYLGIKMNWS